MMILSIATLTLLLLAVTAVFGQDDNRKPPFWKKAETARWLAHENLWGTFSTSSLHLNKQAWGQPKSFVDGSNSNSTGVLYFYDSDMDVSVQDANADSRVAFSLSMAQQNLCPVDKLDPEDPRCARVVFSGNFVEVTDPAELSFAKQALFERHPAMETWPTDHDWKVHTITLSEIWLIDIYGGAGTVDISEYYAVDVTALRAAKTLPAKI
eukprot:scaffold988_cov165-Ochromonas_danica.AAC.15